MTVVIIFGPTGHVGSAAALSAHSFGASKVVLAMRDTAKPIPGLSSTLEASKPFQRVHADLLEPETVTTAVTTTGATRAFLYQTFTSQDHLLSVIQALKASGIQFVVFLSTATLAPGTDLASVSPAVDPIGYTHAQVELNLLSVFGKKGFASVRPAFFATNAIAWWGRMIPAGKIKVFASEVKVDWIAPDDIGRVSSAILLSGGVKEGDEEAVWLVGPQKVSLRDGILAIAKRVNGTEAEVEDVNAEEGVKVLVGAGLPQPVASHLVESFGNMKKILKSGAEENWLPVGAAWEEAIAVVEKYTGTPAMKLEEWIERYKDEFKG